MKHQYMNPRAKAMAIAKHGNRELTVSMTREGYKYYMTDKRDEKGHVIEHGFKNDDQLLDYVNATFGLLGTVTEIVLEN